MKSVISPRTISILLLSTICVVASATTSSHKSSKNTERQYNDIGVSHHQGQIGWKEVAKNERIKFIYVRTIQGTNIRDKNYGQNIKTARHQGLRCGSYHYLSCLTSVRSQFRNFQKAMRGRKQDLVPMIDIGHDNVRRWSRKQMQDNVALFARLIERKYDKKPLIYSHASFYNSYLNPQFSKYFLFLGKYSSVRPSIKGVGRHNIWQFSDRGRVRSTRGYVDLDRFMSGTSLATIRL